jgi:hypothetical protein
MLLGLPGLSGCVAYGQAGYYAPPPPAYADNGAAYYYDDVTLVFDVGWNGWLVRGHPNHYYCDGYYYRWNGGYWDRSRHFRRGWTRANIGSVPPRLHNRRSHRRHRDSAIDPPDRSRHATGAGRAGPRVVAAHQREDRRTLAQNPPAERREARRDVRRETPRVNRSIRREEAPQAPREDRRVVAMQDRRAGHRTAPQAQRPERKQAVRKKRGGTPKAEATAEGQDPVELARSTPSLQR